MGWVLRLAGTTQRLRLLVIRAGLSTERAPCGASAGHAGLGGRGDWPRPVHTEARRFHGTVCRRADCAAPRSFGPRYGDVAERRNGRTHTTPATNSAFARSEFLRIALWQALRGPGAGYLPATQEAACQQAGSTHWIDPVMLSQKSKYALKAMILAKEYGRGPVLISLPPKRRHAVANFSNCILLELRNRGVCKAKRTRGNAPASLASRRSRSVWVRFSRYLRAARASLLCQPHRLHALSGLPGRGDLWSAHGDERST